ncbi:MAG: PQQ-dependent sugar dehydrogenase [Anaerolineales bacterium]|nr:PQQ-dependent sugar dehydrogenase [Anaerolineales bacterium]
MKEKKTKNYWYVFLLFVILVACQTQTAPTPNESSSGFSPLPTPPTIGNPQPTAAEIAVPIKSAGDDSASPQPLATVESSPVSLTFPDPASYRWVAVAKGLESPVGLGYTPDGSGRLLILEQEGTIRLWQDNNLSNTAFLDIRDRVGSRGSEQGLLGIAFHPKYAENGYFYVNYTDRDGSTVIARFQANPPSANLADSASEKILLRIAQPYANHNGGAVVFGPDGFLYLGLGDGGSAGDPQNNAQSLNTLLGKILRLDVDNGEPYAIPTSNPYVNGGGLPEIWAYGLRNPWRMSFDRQTGDLYIGDVGQNQWEEIDYLPNGSSGDLNFGWKYLEGTHPYQGTPPAGVKLIPPIYEYGHDQGCSVTGGVLYRGRSLPEWNGVYFFSDYCAGWVDGLRQLPDGTWQAQRLFRDLGRISSFGEDEQGEIYLIDHAGTVYRLEQP